MRRWTGSPEGVGTQGTSPAASVACVGREQGEAHSPRGRPRRRIPVPYSRQREWQSHRSML